MCQEKINEYINKQESLQREILIKLRNIFVKTLKNPIEKIKWGVIVIGQDKFYLAAFKERIHIGFAINGLEKEEVKLFEGSGKTMRHIKIYSLKDIDDKKIVKLIKMVEEKANCTESS